MSDKKIDTRLSYSSANLLKNCSQKYYYYKVAGVPKDPDSEENNEAFNVGKAFHWVLEENKHTEKDLLRLLEAAVKSFEVEEHQGMIHAMLLRHLQCHQESGLEVVACEVGLGTDDFVGYIDAVLQDPDSGEWWITDLKTASRLSDILVARLHLDAQLNLYAAFADKVAELFKLDPQLFKGCRYRVTTKSVLKKKTTESYNDHVKRTAKNVKSYDYIVPLERMDPKAVMKDHKKLHAMSLKLRSGKAKPHKNTSFCDSFFRPCEYWSQCYGATFTELKDSLPVVTSKNV